VIDHLCVGFACIQAATLPSTETHGVIFIIHITAEYSSTFWSGIHRNSERMSCDAVKLIGKSAVFIGMGIVKSACENAISNKEKYIEKYKKYYSFFFVDFALFFLFLLF
jgi:hypothetical protein